jgi:hypothetical protein
MNSKTMRLKPRSEMSLLALALRISEAREHDISSPHQTRIRREHHIGIAILVCYVLKPRPEAKKMVVQVVPLLSGKILLRYP